FTATHLVTGSINGSGQGNLVQTFAALKAIEYTLSVVAKIDGTGGWLFFGLSDYTANAFGSFFNLNTGLTGSSSVAGSCTFVAANISSLGSGWYLCSVTGTSSA